MAAVNRTLDFREVLEQRQHALPRGKRHKISRTTSGPNYSQITSGKEYITEAYAILEHINTLTRMLANIRKPYLNVDARSAPISRQSSGHVDFSASDQSWSGIRHLTSEERDQIDTQARVILTRCAERVKEMEALEKRRAEIVSSKSNMLTRWLPARLVHDERTISSDFVAAHRSSVTWYLNRRLAEASQSQKEMQEERVRRQLERNRTLGSGAAREALSMGVGEPPMFVSQGEGGKGSWLERAPSSLASGLAATISKPLSRELSRAPQLAELPTSSSDEEDDELELSQSQILQFETENANILRSAQDTLESVQLAESRLMEISALQMELVTHLTRQTEVTNQLFEDAIATTSTVEKGNVQLREAKRRAKDGRIFILVFLIGASLSLLFLHYY